MRDRNGKLAICVAAAIALGVVAAPPSATAKKRKVIATTEMDLTATRTGSNVISFTVRLDTRRACRGGRHVAVHVSNELPVDGRTKADGTFSGSVTVENPVGTRFLYSEAGQRKRETKKRKLTCAAPQNASTQVEMDPLPPEAP